MAPSYGSRRRVGFKSRRGILLLCVVCVTVVSFMIFHITHLYRIDSTPSSTPSSKPTAKAVPKPPPLVILEHPPQVVPSDVVNGGVEDDNGVYSLLHSLGKCTLGAGNEEDSASITDLWQSPRTVANMRRGLADHLRVTKQQQRSDDSHGSVPLVFPGVGTTKDHVAVPVHDMSRSSMQIDVQLFVVWPAAMGVLERILKDVSKNFLVVKVAHFAWEPKVGPTMGGGASSASPSDPVTEQERFYLEHLWRLYSGKGGLSRAEMLTKVYQVGGPQKSGFVAIVVMNPGAAESGIVEYAEMPTAHGKDHVSKAMFEKKKLYRKWAQNAHVSEDVDHTKLLEKIGKGSIPKGSHAVSRVSNNFRVHGTYTSIEAEHDIRVLFGVTPLDLALSALIPTGTPCPTHYTGDTSTDFMAFMGDKDGAKNSRFMTIRGAKNSNVLRRADGGDAWVAPLGVVETMGGIYSPRGSETAMSIPQPVVQWPTERSMLFALAASVATVESGISTVNCGDDSVCSPQPSTHPDQLSVYLGGGVDPRLASSVGTKSFKVDRSLNAECLSKSKLFDWRRFDHQYLGSTLDTSCIQSIDASGGSSESRFNALRITVSNHHSLQPQGPASVADDTRLVALWNIAAVLYGSPVRGSQGRCDAPSRNVDAVDLESLHDFVSGHENHGLSNLVATTSKDRKEQQRVFTELLTTIRREGSPGCASMWFLASIAKTPIVIEIQITL